MKYLFLTACCFIVSFCLLPAISAETIHHQNTISKAASSYTWEEGFSQFDSGYISSGLKILDSLSQLHPDNASGIQLFTNKTLSLFSADSHSRQRNLPNKNFSFMSSFIADTLQASSFKTLLISRSSGAKYHLPGFKYTTVFNVKKPIQLIFDGLIDNSRPALKMRRDIIYTTPDFRLTDQLDNKDDSISCTILIDFNVQIAPIPTYLKDHFSGVFDSIDFKHDLDQYNAFSLRGYTRKNWSIENGQFTAVIAFDKIMPDRKVVKGKTATVPLPVRYTVVIQSPGCVRELAESKLQSLISLL